ncbi:MAG: sulfatase-like hydrolase/transferase [Verrucomicrobiota bacterium]
MKNTPSLTLGALLLVSPAALPATGLAATGRPNILFVTTDQQTASALSCAGNPDVRTPNLDRLAARGVRFTKSYVANPLCVPSRASIFSSRMPHELGIYGNTMDAELEKKGVPTMGELFRGAGYETAYAGKWHVHAAFPAYMGRTIPGFTVLPQGGKDPRQGDKKTEEKAPQCDPYTADAAVRFLRQPHSKPFLLVVSLLNPHDICEFNVYEGFRKMLPADPAQLTPLRPNLRDAGKLPSELQNDRKKRVNWTDLQWRQYLWVYYRLVESSDELIGRVLGALEQTGLGSNTIVVFTSDHGEMMGSHGLVTKEKLYEESASVPLVIAPPGVTPGVDRQHLVSGLDLMPTFLDYAGITAPASLEGRSLRPLVAGNTVPWRDFVASETFAPEARMIRTTRHKYILFAQGENREQFFDLEKDPGETNNLADNPAVAGEVARHRSLLQEWMRATGDISGKRWDADKDGVLSREEFLNEVGKPDRHE